ncbi:Complex 1 protein (LYR family)/Complex1 LYR-like [Novymonas esmeraldas]|uniref:Complex 1 protein (LYR family)/Complex1 LYR-like n=1 Tax=Novymonas esmeraldas TaxID=1808958 RepID=A0AAW0ETI7_9TRYP
MLRRFCSPLAVAATGLRFNASNGGTFDGGDEPIPNSTGKDNAPGLYSKKTPDAYFEERFPDRSGDVKSLRPQTYDVPPGRSDNIKSPEFNTSLGKFEQAPYFTGGPPAMRYHGYKRESANKEGVDYRDVLPKVPMEDHHPNMDFLSVTGRREGSTFLLANAGVNWELKASAMSLYRTILKALPMIKHYYWLLIPLPQMKDKIRFRFLQNQHTKDPDAIRHLLHNGWMEFQESIMFRRPRATIEKYFEYESMDTLIEQYTREEGLMNHEREFWNGEEQRREGPHNGHWSWLGEQCEQEFSKIAGRIPMSWTTSKGYFEKGQADGTNYWEKNLDYEGWYIKNVDPDRQNARREMQGWVESGYNQPKHYASKNRRGYRRMVKDIETLMETSMEDLYTHNREQLFQYLIRETSPESNRINAERTLAYQDDDFYSTRFDEYEKYVKQAMREMPNPRLWKTDAFYFRLRYLIAPLEYNWAKVPVGTAQERLFNEWISDNCNYAVYTSDAFAQIKADKMRNPMARTWADFYTDFDPDVPDTRLLPWYHKDFDYDRRHKWDERCMRMKRWVQGGTIDGKHAFFDSIIAEWEQYVNRPERFRAPDNAERRYAAPRMVQLYRALNRVMDVALANQMRQALEKGGDFSKLSAEEVQKRIAAADFTKFRFDVPVVIYPDGLVQPQLGLDGGSSSGTAATATATADA